MKEQNTDLEIIEQFLEGGLSESDKSDVERRLENDSEFLELFNYRKNIAAKWQEANKYAEVKNRVSHIIRNKKKAEKQKRYSAIAVVLILMIVFPGIFFYSKINTNEHVVVIANPEISVTQPEEKAALSYFDEDFKLVTPNKDQVIDSENRITFQWRSSLDVTTFLVIKNTETDSIVSRTAIKSSTKIYELDRKLTAGTYVWELEGFESKQQFVIR